MINTLSYSTTNVTTSAYVQIVASTSLSASQLVIVDTSTQLVKLAIGAAGSQIDLCVFQGNGNPVSVPIYIPAGSTLWLKAISGSATSGYNTVSFF